MIIINRQTSSNLHSPVTSLVIFSSSTEMKLLPLDLETPQFLLGMNLMIFSKYAFEIRVYAVISKFLSIDWLHIQDQNLFFHDALWDWDLMPAKQIPHKKTHIIKQSVNIVTHCFVLLEGTTRSWAQSSHELRYVVSNSSLVGFHDLNYLLLVTRIPIYPKKIFLHAVTSLPPAPPSNHHYYKVDTRHIFMLLPPNSSPSIRMQQQKPGLSRPDQSSPIFQCPFFGILNVLLFQFLVIREKWHLAWSYAVTQCFSTFFFNSGRTCSLRKNQS